VIAARRSARELVHRRGVPGRELAEVRGPGATAS
jgi:hypothetical protein